MIKTGGLEALEWRYCQHHTMHHAMHDASEYRRVELITGRRKRRNWSDEEKIEILAVSNEAGANISEVVSGSASVGACWASGARLLD
ncbi:transposase [Rhizobium sp. NXC14]|uniref:transposase n=1 Tax=Rhizobium sp. NXC14 TaxID=1981173 RepID=UPI001FDA93EF|nr:transposase [Rhizobium sp. NXC14]